MKRLLLILSVILCAWTLSPTPEADASGSNNSRHGRRHHVWHRAHKSGFAVPELDPSAAGSAIVLLLGGMAFIASRRKEDLV
ncbi:MAG: hypothetical protein WCE62_05515 [Polyangiales bacterium]